MRISSSRRSSIRVSSLVRGSPTLVWISSSIRGSLISTKPFRPSLSLSSSLYSLPLVVVVLCIYVTHGCTGTLDGLVGSHTRQAIYPTLAICCQRVVIHASLNNGFKGMQVVTYPANVKQLKSHWLKVPQKGLGTCIWINKSHSPFWLCSAPWEALR